MGADVPARGDPEILRAGYLMNFALAEIIWTADEGLWWPRLKFWHTRFVRWDWTAMAYKVQTANGEITRPPVDENLYGGGKWFVWCPSGTSTHGCAGRSVRWPAVRGARVDPAGLRTLLRDPRNGAAEGHRAGWQRKREGRRGLRRAGCEPPRRADDHASPGRGGEQVRHRVRRGAGSHVGAFKDFKAQLDTDIAVLVLGQNLTTEAAGGGWGAARRRPTTWYGSTRRRRTRASPRRFATTSCCRGPASTSMT